MAEKKNYLTNFSYCFIPFSFENEKGLKYFNERLTSGRVWHPVEDKIRYLHKYVSDKLMNENCDKKGCFHYKLDKQAAFFYGLYLEDERYCISPEKYMGKSNVHFNFSVDSVELFAFSTTVCVLAFKLRFTNSDLRQIAAAQYYIRKISSQKESEKVRYVSETKEVTTHDFVDISKGLFRDLEADFKFDFFFYSAPKQARANFLTYVDITDSKKKEKLEEDLFFLKWCYHDGFVYDPVSDKDDGQDYIASSDVTWGISPSAAVCVVDCPKQRREFIETTFQKNFTEQYLFTYVLLLHQKYVMYFLLTEIGNCDNNDLESLEDYKHRLYEFETDFVFSHITEVPQYQRLYECVSKSFSLKEMFEDVREPLTRLAEIQHQKRDDEEKSRDKAMNNTLCMLSVLTVFSAIADAAGITANLGWVFNTVWSRIIQVIAIMFSLVVTSVVAAGLIKLLKKK